LAVGTIHRAGERRAGCGLYDRRALAPSGGPARDHEAAQRTPRTLALSTGSASTGAAPGPERRAAVGLVLTGIASVQLGSALATTVFDEVGPAGTVFLRTAFAAIVLAAIWRPAHRGIDRRTRRAIALFGLCLLGMNLCFYEALERIPLGIAVTLEFVGPLAVAILGSRGRIDLLWALLATAGILLLAPGIGDGLAAEGVALALLAGGFWGAYIMLAASIGRGPAGHGGLSAAMIIAAVLLVPIGIADGGGGLLHPATLAIGLGVALLSSVLPYTVELEALRRLPERTFGVMLSLEPAVAALVGLAVLGQDLAGREVLAIAFVIAASAGALSAADTVEAPQS
jgi:inner membrane transporter RhtA